MDKVTNFYPRMIDLTVMDFYFGGLAFVISNFYARISDEDAAADKMDRNAVFVAQYGNGLDATIFTEEQAIQKTLCQILSQTREDLFVHSSTLLIMQTPT